MATDRTNIGNKFEDGDIPSHKDFKEIFDSFVHRDEDKADFQMVENGLDTEHYVTPALLNVGLKNIGIITGNCYMPHKENFENSFSGTILHLEYFPIPNSVKVFKNGQLLQEGPDYTVNYDMAQIKFLETVSNRNLEVDYWYKNLSPNPGSGSATAIDFTSFLHTSGNETKNGLLTFNNTTTTSTSGIILKNSGAATGATSLDVTNSGAGSGILLQNSSTGIGVKVSNAGAGVAVNVNSAPGSTGDILQVSKNNVVQTKIDSEGNVTAPKFVSSGGTRSEFVKGDGFLDPTVYAEDTKVIHTTGNESKDGALTLINSSPQDVLTIEKNDDANCLKLVQNSNSDATTSTWDTSTTNSGRKAISIRKLGDETAFITHDGDVAALSISTTKANLTDDGLFSLENRPSPESSEGKAKLYAKNDGTDTNMYVMGSDGVEKKIGGEVDLSGKENTIAPGTTAQYYRGDKTWQTLDKTAVGLANVENTSDLNKPVSTAMQTALNLKANLASPSLTGVPTAPTATVGTNTTQIATTAFVLANSSTTVPTLQSVLTSNNSMTNKSIYAKNSTASQEAYFRESGIDFKSDQTYGIVGTYHGNLGSNALGFNYSNGGPISSIQIQPAPLSGGDSKVVEIQNKSGTFALLSDLTTSAEPTQITITTAVSITTDTLDANSKKQIGKNVIINNGASAINITVNGGTDFCASYLKHGTGAITFVQAAGRTLVQVNTTAILNGAVGSTATISSIGTTDYLRISNV